MRERIVSRRVLLKGSTAVATALAVKAMPVLAAVLPKLACGCPRIYPQEIGHTCTIHDETGRRWDSYTAEEIAAMNHEQLEVQTRETEWSCYCGRHDHHPDNLIPVGAKGIWRSTSYEYDEAEFECADAYRERWLVCQTTDWTAMAIADGLYDPTEQVQS